MKFGLNEIIITQIKEVFFKYSQVESAIIYGSRAKGNYKNGSDIDLTLIGKNLNLDVINKISWDLDDLMLPYTFDLSIYRQIKDPGMLNHIKRVGINFYELK